MNSDKTVAIVASNSSERHSLNRLLASEGFLVEPFPGPEAFLNRIDLTEYGCLIVDVDFPAEEAAGEIPLDFARRLSKTLPVIITSDPSRLPRDFPVPCLSKGTEENRLLYHLYGALGQAPVLSS